MSSSNNPRPLLNIIHFNDVYNITETNNDKCCGGAARFKTIIEKLKCLKPEPLVFFSGDFLNPSQLSTITNGEHMIPVMNEFGITCSMIGNHDLDFGNEHCIKCLSQLNFPTLNSNIFTPKQLPCDDPDDESLLEPLGQCRKELVLQHNGLNIGLIGVSEDWCNTIPVKPENGIIYKDYKAQCSKYIAKLRNEHKLDVVIVLTHSRKENDIELANSVQGIDLILGGHDHLYHVGLNDKYKSLLVKSGCDFQGVTYIRMMSKDSKQKEKGDDLKVLSELNQQCLVEAKKDLDGVQYRYSTYHYMINKTLAPNPKMAKLVDSLSAEFLAKISKPIGVVHCDLDTRFVHIRRKESAACNLICDIVRNGYRVDVVILCGGGIRSDTIHEKGVLTHKDILDMVPFQDPVIVKKMKGKKVREAIAHSILNLPKLDGRFAHVSGLKYVYDSSQKPSDRLVNVMVNCYGDESKGQLKWSEIEDDKFYTVASREYTMNGGDGFEMLNEPEHEVLVDDEMGQALSVVLRNFFWAISAVNDALKMMNDHDTKSNQKFIDDLSALIKELAVEPTVDTKEDDAQSDDSGSSKGSSGGNGVKTEEEEMKETDSTDTLSNFDDLFLKIWPQIEHRITDIANDDEKTEETEQSEVVEASSTDINTEIDAFVSSKWHHLPQWLYMAEKPSGMKSIASFIGSLEVEEDDMTIIE